MIRLTRLKGDAVFVNSDLIETIEPMPDTVLILISGNRITVQETPEDVAELVRAFRQSVFRAPLKGIGC